MDKEKKYIRLADPRTQTPVRVGYTLKVSGRARRLSMRITMENGLEVIIPERFNQTKILPFMEGHARWIINNMTKRQIKKRTRERDELKDGSVIRIMGEAKTIRVLPTRRKKSFIKEARSLKYDKDTAYYDNEEIIVFLPQTVAAGGLSLPSDQHQMDNPKSGQSMELKKALEKHLRAKSKKLFQKRTAEIAAQMGLAYNRVTVKAQKTRWGSCSRDKNLNFNWRLILAEPQTMDSIIVHELAHLVHLNHGRRFYDLVEKYSPDHKLHSKKLKETVFPV